MATGIPCAFCQSFLHYDSLQLNRVEMMVCELLRVSSRDHETVLTQVNHVKSGVDQCASSCFVPDSCETPVVPNGFISKSKQRRLREVQTKQRLWSRIRDSSVQVVESREAIMNDNSLSEIRFSGSWVCASNLARRTSAQ